MEGLPVILSKKEFDYLVVSLNILDENKWPDLQVRYMEFDDKSIVLIGVGPETWTANQTFEVLSERMPRPPKSQLIKLDWLRIPENRFRFLVFT